MTGSARKGGITFELRKYTGGRCLLDSIYDDKVFAIAEANALMERSTSLQAVHVVAVAEENGLFREWTVFKRGIAEHEWALQRAFAVKPMDPQTRPKARDPEVRRQPRPAEAHKNLFFWMQVIARVAFVTAAAVAGFYLLRLMS